MSSLLIINAWINKLNQQSVWELMGSDEKKQQVKNVVDSGYPYSLGLGWAYQSWLDARADIFVQWGIATRRTKQRPPANRANAGTSQLLSRQDS